MGRQLPRPRGGRAAGVEEEVEEQQQQRKKRAVSMLARSRLSALLHARCPPFPLQFFYLCELRSTSRACSQVKKRVAPPRESALALELQCKEKMVSPSATKKREKKDSLCLSLVVCWFSSMTVEGSDEQPQLSRDAAKTRSQSPGRKQRELLFLRSVVLDGKLKADSLLSSLSLCSRSLLLSL